jgi:hypothetical protein
LPKARPGQLRGHHPVSEPAAKVQSLQEPADTQPGPDTDVDLSAEAASRFLAAAGLARVSDDHAVWRGVSAAGKLFPGPLAPMT